MLPFAFLMPPGPEPPLPAARKHTVSWHPVSRGAVLLPQSMNPPVIRLREAWQSITQGVYFTGKCLQFPWLYSFTLSQIPQLIRTEQQSDNNPSILGAIPPRWLHSQGLRAGCVNVLQIKVNQNQAYPCVLAYNCNSSTWVGSRQEDQEFKVSSGYITNLKPAWATIQSTLHIHQDYYNKKTKQNVKGILLEIVYIFIKTYKQSCREI